MRHRVIMLETAFASEDGINPKHYLKGKNYYVSDHLLEAFIKMGVVRLEGEQDQTDFEGYETKINPPARRGRPKKQ